MAKRQVFYSFHYQKDVMRVQQIRNMGALEGNVPVSPNEWETVHKGGERAIKKWIDTQMRYRSCVIVLIGEQTATRKLVRYEIQKAWLDGKGLFGIYIHNLKCPREGTTERGVNPFEQFELADGRRLSDIIPCYDPTSNDAYNEIKHNIENWIESAIQLRKQSASKTPIKLVQLNKAIDLDIAS